MHVGTYSGKKNTYTQMSHVLLITLSHSETTHGVHQSLITITFAFYCTLVSKTKHLKLQHFDKKQINKPKALLNFKLLLLSKVSGGSPILRVWYSFINTLAFYNLSKYINPNTATYLVKITSAYSNLSLSVLSKEEIPECFFAVI